MNLFNDTILTQMYIQYAIPCDRLVSNPNVLANFASDYTKRTGHRVELGSLGHHMLNLRRKGQAKGGLPRLKRRYNGRN